MARPSEYNFLKQHKGVSVIYALYTDVEGVRYIGHSFNVFERFRNHLSNHKSEKNIAKFNWINKYKKDVKIKILSTNHENWEVEEIKQISLHKNLLNICAGGKNNRIHKPFESLTNREHLIEINKSLKELNKFYASKGKVFELFSNSEIERLS